MITIPHKINPILTIKMICFFWSSRKSGLIPGTFLYRSVKAPWILRLVTVKIPLATIAITIKIKFHIIQPLFHLAHPRRKINIQNWWDNDFFRVVRRLFQAIMFYHHCQKIGNPRLDLGFPILLSNKFYLHILISQSYVYHCYDPDSTAEASY